MIAIAAIVLISMGIILIVSYYHKPAQNASILVRSDNQATEKTAGGSKNYITPVDNYVPDKVGSEPTDELKLSPKAVEQSDEVLAWLDSLGEASQTEMPVGEESEAKSPAEILKRFLEIINSPEFRAEQMNILVNSRRQQLTYIKKIGEMEQKIKELERALGTASEENLNSVQDDLGKLRSTLKEAKIDLTKEVILQDDSIQRQYLRHFTINEIQIARQEMNKGKPSPSSHVMNEEEKEINIEATRRLKESGWTPAIPD